ncbi:MAG TPA: hypothetical protein VMH40_14225 [Myxococcaceae bacterium]|nr:hypothetical protein [Myxococcaceae bacterium]
MGVPPERLAQFDVTDDLLATGVARFASVVGVACEPFQLSGEQMGPLPLVERWAE